MKLSFASRKHCRVLTSWNGSFWYYVHLTSYSIYWAHKMCCQWRTTNKTTPSSQLWRHCCAVWRPTCKEIGILTLWRSFTSYFILLFVASARDDVGTATDWLTQTSQLTEVGCDVITAMGFGEMATEWWFLCYYGLQLLLMHAASLPIMSGRAHRARNLINNSFAKPH